MLEVNLTEFPVLETDRLVLRQFKLSDAQQLFKMRSSAEVMRYLDREPMQQIAEAEVLIQTIIKTFQDSNGISWALTQKGDDDLIGFAGIWQLTKEHYRGEVGYTLMQEFWNKGIMSEALRAIIRFGFESMGLHSLEANINPHNDASIKLVERLGFVREAYFRENYYYKGKFLDSAIYSLINQADQSRA